MHDSLEKNPEQPLPLRKDKNHTVEERRVLVRQHSPEDRRATQVHRILYSLAFSPSNVLTLCPACNLSDGAVTAAESSMYCSNSKNSYFPKSAISMLKQEGKE